MNSIFRRAVSMLVAVIIASMGVIPALAENGEKVYNTETGYPLLADIERELYSYEIVRPKDVTVNQGDDSFQLVEREWFGKEEDPSYFVIATHTIRDSDGNKCSFSVDNPGKYKIYYVIMPYSEHPSYEVSRMVTVKAKPEEPVQVESEIDVKEEVETNEQTDRTDEVFQNTEEAAEEPDGQENASEEESALVYEAEEVIEPAEEAEQTEGTETADEPEAEDEPVSEPVHDTEIPEIGDLPSAEIPPAMTETPTDEVSVTVTESIEPAEPEQETAQETVQPDTAGTAPADENAGDTEAEVHESELSDEEESPELQISTINEPDEPDDEAPSDDAPAEDEPAAEDDDEVPVDNIVISGSAKLDRGERIVYPSDLGEHSTFKYVIDGKIGYCVQSDKASPRDGSFQQQVFESNSGLNKALYYGYGGKGDLSAEFFPEYGVGLRYIMTHMAASYLYTGDYAKATTNCTSSGLAKYRFDDWVEFLVSQPDPPSPGIELTSENLTIVSSAGGVQTTSETKLKGDSRNYITLTIPDSVTYHNKSTGETVTGGSVNIYGGTTFYFTAPLTMDGTWESGYMNGSINYIWKAIIVTTGTKTQDLGCYAVESYGKTVSFSVEWESEVTLNVIKADTDNTDLHLPGAVIGVYADSECSTLIERLTTGEDGSASVSLSCAYGTVYVQELTAPDGYRLNGRSYSVELGENASVTVMITDEKQKAGLRIYKKGDMLTGADVTESGIIFKWTMKYLSGAEYRITAAENIYSPDWELLFQKGAVVVDHAVTNKDGEVFISDMPLGRYIVEETKAPEGYVLSGEKKTVALEYAGQNAEVAFEETTFTDERQKIELTAKKTDAGTGAGLSGAVFGLYTAEDIKNVYGDVIAENGLLIASVTTGRSGTGVFSVDLPIGFKYVVREIAAPAGYSNDSDDVSFTFSYAGQEAATVKYTLEFKNTPLSASVKLTKLDKETGNAQGDASLDGAVYGLYARENIVLSDGSGTVLYEKDALVASLTTSGGGYAKADNLQPGRYYLKEITPSAGYNLDTSVYDVDLTKADANGNITENITVYEQVMKQPFQIIKAVENGSTDAPLLEGAGFSAWLVSDLRKKADGSYDFDSADPVAIGKNGAQIIYTDERGYAVSAALPYGTYIVRETVTPANYSPVDDFIVTVSRHSPDTPQVWRVLLDREFSARLRIIKTDADTGRIVLVSGAQFTVYDIDAGEYVTQVSGYPNPTRLSCFITDSSGTLTLPEPLSPGHYRIQEIGAPDGYLLSDAYAEITISEDSVYRIDTATGDPVIEVTLSDKAASGKIRLIKEGETIIGYENGKFIYGPCYMNGVVFEVYAAEDIYSSDRQTDEDGNRYIEIAADTMVARLVTDGSGEAVSGELPLGRYYVIEKGTPAGYIPDTEKHYLTLSYAGQNTAVSVSTVSITNERQKVSVYVEKQSSDGKNRLSGAAFAIYAGEPIYANGVQIVSAGTCLATAKTDSTGNAEFDIDLPFGKYLISEIEAPAGYILSDEIREITVNPGKGETVSVKEVFKNDPIKVAVSKADITTGVELDGATLTLLDKNGNIIETWVSVAGSPHIVDGLTAGETYTLREDTAPYGYLISESVKFTVSGGGEVQKVVMYDKAPTGTIIINKSGEFLSGYNAIDSAVSWISNAFAYISGSLKDVTFDVYAYEDITHPDKATPPYYTAGTYIATITTDSSGYASLSGLPLGKYYVVESDTAEGYLLDDEKRIIDLSYRDSETAVVKYLEAWQNERRKITVSVLKTDGTTEKPLEGAAFGLYSVEDIRINGTVMLRKDTMIEQKATGSDGKLVFESDIPVGYSFYVKEVLPPAGYTSNPDAQTFRFTDESPAQLEFSFTDNATQLLISKTTVAGDELPGAKLTILNAKGETVESWVSTDKPHYIEMLPVGKYTLREESAPYGYKVAEDVTFEVTDTNEVQKVTMVDKVQNTESPKTGDDRNPVLWITVSVTALLGAALMIWSIIRRRS